MAEQVIIFDTTLRDGEQSPGHLARRGREAGDRRAARPPRRRRHRGRLPGRQPGRLRGRPGHRQGGAGPDHLRPVPHRAQATSTAAGRRSRTRRAPRIHVFIATSEIHMEHKLRMTPDQVKAEAAPARRPGQGLHRRRRVLARGRQSRSDFDFMCEVLQIAVDNGATTLNIPDTVGYGIPEEYGEPARQRARRSSAATTSISTHCHDDLGWPWPTRWPRVAGRRPPGRVRHQRHR